MKLLIADDEQVIRDGLNRLDWTQAGINEVRSVDNGIDALRLVSAWKPDVILTDIRMAGIDGLQLAKEIKAGGEKCRLIILSGYGTFEYAREAMRSGVFEFLLKPSNPEEIYVAVKRAVAEMQREGAQKAGDTMSIQREEIFHGGEDAGMIGSILDYIERNYMEDITLQTLSDYTHLSVNYLSRLIKKETSYNFTRILCIVRMVKAAELLSTTDLKVYEICGKIGMGDQRYFGQLFARTFGMTPMEYRKTNKQRVESSLLDFIKQIR